MRTCPMKAIVLPLVLVLAFTASARGDDKVGLPVPGFPP